MRSPALVVLCTLLIAQVSYCLRFIDENDHLNHDNENVEGWTEDRRVKRNAPREIIPQNRTSCQPGAPVALPDRVNTTDRLRQLREKLRDLAVGGGKGIDAFIINNYDAHLGSGSQHFRRMQYMTGFTGSSGVAVVTLNRAALWTDSRYWEQADRQMDCNWSLMKSGLAGVPTAMEWLLSQLQKGSKVGADSRSMRISNWKSWTSGLHAGNISLVDTPTNPVDLIWTKDRPSVPNNPIYVHTMEFTGKSWQDKVADVNSNVKEFGCQALVLTSLDQSAWLLNLRGSDYLTSPLFYSYVIAEETRIRLYVRNVSVMLSSPAVRDHLNTNSDGGCAGKTAPCVQVLEYDSAIADMRRLTQQSNVSQVWLSPRASYAVYSASGGEIKAMEMNTPVKMMKAVKNEVEQKRYRECQIRDSAAVIEFAAFMEKEISEGRSWNEFTAGTKISEMRQKQAYFRGLSFNPISSSGPNAAMAHYIPRNATSRPLGKHEPYLLDSGGQYLDGTTDITRTFHFGTPTAKQKEAYTRVLMGHIDVASLVWPKGMTASAVDLLARRPLWSVGWDYGHGTGHGIGYFLNVHEGPGYIGSSDVFEAGMFLSDEPGYYETGNFGIRLESIVGVVTKNTTYNFRDREWLAFEAVSLVPFIPKFIDYSLLSERQISWLNTYNKRCLDTVGPYLKQQKADLAYDWLVRHSQPIRQSACVSAAPSVSSTMQLTIFLFAFVNYVLKCN